MQFMKDLMKGTRNVYRRKIKSTLTSSPMMTAFGYRLCISTHTDLTKNHLHISVCEEHKDDLLKCLREL